MGITITETRVQDQSSACNINYIINATGDLPPTLYQQLINEFKSYLASTKANAESASGYAVTAEASALECSRTLESVTSERKSAETNAASAEDAQKSASISAAEAKKSENAVKNAITEANYQLLYLENGRLMLYQSDATSNDLDFHIKDHRNLEVTFS